MPEPALIPPPLSTPVGLLSRRGRREIPADSLRDASRRLGILSLVGDPRWREPSTGDVIAAVSVLASLTLFAHTRRQDRDPRVILDLGLLYMVLIALALAVMMHTGRAAAPTSLMPFISWIGAGVLMFAALVPSTPGKTLAAGLIAVSMNPLTMITKHLQAEPAPPSTCAELPVPAGLDRVVLQCLAKKPAARPRSAADLTRQLAAIDAEPWGDEQARAWWAVHVPALTAASPASSSGTQATTAH
ncbi:MAG: hypothetical protein HYU37_01570 [Acidobacteria bacterium]|nr:hypothetical protein [Acidobacteriota bacterium]